MDTLIRRYKRLLTATSTTYIRSLMNTINWDNRLIAIRGARGVGKTTLARIIANQTKAKFINFSAVTSGIKDIRAVMKQAQEVQDLGEKTIVFVDEIHRFNKAQQDAFLPYVEQGSIILIGATTENPSFEINSALLSRCKVFVLKALTTDDLFGLLHYALISPKGFKDQNVKIDEDAYKVYPDFKDKKAVRKELLKNLPTNKVLYLLTASEQTFTLAFDVVKDLEKSGRLYDNSRYMGGKDDSDAGAENIKANIHKFWFMKIPRGSTVYDDGVNVGIGIGIGRRHRGGIGIGW